MMERLTNRIPVPDREVDVIVFTQGKYNDTIPAEMTHDDIRTVLRKLAEYEDFEEIFREKMTDTACEFLSDKEEFGKWLERIHWINQKCDEWVRAEEQGLLLQLPCKVGDMVYKPNPITNKEIVEIKIESIFITESKINISGHTTKMKYSFCCSPDDFGKTVFLTKAEAEKKLKEIKET